MKLPITGGGRIPTSHLFFIKQSFQYWDLVRSNLIVDQRVPMRIIKQASLLLRQQVVLHKYTTNPHCYI